MSEPEVEVMVERAALRFLIVSVAMMFASAGVGVEVLVAGNEPRGMLWEPGSTRSWEGIGLILRCW